MSSDSLATLVIVPRERFSSTRESLESICAHTPREVPIVYVDGGSPRGVRRYLQSQAADGRIQVIRHDSYLSPNKARNIGLGFVRSRYCIFLDNDVIASQGWLDSLVACAEETGADVVGPMTCQGQPVHEIVHFAHGNVRISLVQKDGGVERHLVEHNQSTGRRRSALIPVPTRQPSGLVEFHCMLVRTDTLRALGGLDEALLNTKEHLDFCLAVTQAGGLIFFEPASVVTYLEARDLHWTDLRFYMIRWSDSWERASLNHLQAKWDLADDYFTRRLAQVGWRRRQVLIRPLFNRIRWMPGNRRLEHWVGRVEHRLNRVVVRLHRTHETGDARR